MASLDNTIAGPRLADAAARDAEGVSLRAIVRAWRAELATFPGRWRRAARIAFVTALGAAVMAAVQIVNPLGVTLLLSFAAPESAFSLRTGTKFLIGTAAVQLLTLFLIGGLVDLPVAHVCVFIAYVAISTYFIYGVSRIGRLWIWAQIPSVTAFYVVIFERRGLGWDNAEMFAGMTIAIALLWLFNNVIWPEPAASILARSLENRYERLRRRLKLLLRIFLAEDDAWPEHDRTVASKLAYHLELLRTATRGASSVRVPAELLAMVTVAERIHNEIDHLCVPACSQGGSPLDETTKRELRDAAGSIDVALGRHIARLGEREKFEERARTPAATTEAAHDEALKAARLRLARLRRSNEAGDLAPDTQLVTLVDHLDNIATLLEVEAAELPPISLPRSARRPKFRLKPFLVRFSVRHTVAMVIAFVAGLFDNNIALHAALWLLMIGGPPSHGATARKFTMRAIGSTLALAAAVLGTMVLAPNFISLPPYSLAIFIGVLLTTYLGEGGGELSYLAIGGTAFVIAFTGPGPRSEVIGSIWTIWGISFGMIIRAIVSVVSIERPNRTLAEEFERPLTALVTLAPGREQATDDIAFAAMEVIGGIEEMLSVATDAQLQGRSTWIDARKLVDTLDTTRRLAFALGNLAVAGERGGTMCEAFDDAVRMHLESWLDQLRSQLEPGALTPAPLRTMMENPAKVDFEKLLEQVKTTASPGSAAAREHITTLIRTLEYQLARVSLR
jgi:hypothetical protein